MTDHHCPTCGAFPVAVGEPAPEPEVVEIMVAEALQDALYGMTMARLHGEDAERSIRETIDGDTRGVEQDEPVAIYQWRDEPRGPWLDSSCTDPKEHLERLSKLKGVETRIVYLQAQLDTTG